ncbi:MAG: histidine phosphatase family protein [Actinomycetota bacterium]|nr:histidine phosphatase family protein [Actinomycetota bacterium]
MSTPPSGRLLLLRHGETEWSRDKKHTGNTDLPLTPAGEEQARQLARLLPNIRPALVLSSPLARALRTAELAGLSDVVVDDDLKEWDYGRYEGLTTAEIREGRPGWSIWTGDPPGGETAEQVAARADRVLRRVSEALHRGDVIIVGHGHFLRMLTARRLELPPSAGQRFFLDTGTLGVLGYEHDHTAMLRWNLPAAAAADVL